MGSHVTLLIVFFIGTFVTAVYASTEANTTTELASTEANTTAEPEFSPKSGDELKKAVDECLEDHVSDPVGPLEDPFTFVLVPAGKDELKEITRSNTGGIEKNELQRFVKEYLNFRDHGMKQLEAIKHASKEAAYTNYSWLDNDTVYIGVEMIVLYPATPVNNYLSVTLYADRDAESKGKPLNSRANAIVHACGINQKLIQGDVFLVRTYDNIKGSQETWKRRDFFASEANDKADWVAAAKTAKHSESGADSNGAAFSEKQGPVSWSQTNDDVEVSIALPKGVKARDISVTMKYNMIKFGLKNGFSMDGDDEKKDSSTEEGATLLQRLQSGLTPHKEIDPDDSTWSLVDGKLVMTLTKKKWSLHWRALYKRER